MLKRSRTQIELKVSSDLAGSGGLPPMLLTNLDKMDSKEIPALPDMLISATVYHKRQALTSY